LPGSGAKNVGGAGESSGEDKDHGQLIGTGDQLSGLVSEWPIKPFDSYLDEKAIAILSS
jgi:hypothetical protein